MSDVTKTGDTFYTNEMVDNVLVSRDGFCDAAALVYANGHDLKDPMLSPVYGDMHGFPPAILTTGTRDLLLSNTVRVHRKLREAGVEAQLEVYEGQSHAQYQFDDRMPETRRGVWRDPAFLRQASRPLTNTNEKAVRTKREYPPSAQKTHEKMGRPDLLELSGSGPPDRSIISFLYGRPRMNNRLGRIHQRRSSPDSIPVVRGVRCCLWRLLRLRHCRFIDLILIVGHKAPVNGRWVWFPLLYPEERPFAITESPQVRMAVFVFVRHEEFDVQRLQRRVIEG